jgi:hypothetical protein
VKRIVLVAAGAAVLWLTACSSSTPGAAGPGTSGQSSSPIVPVSCGQRYHQWNHHQGKGLLAALRQVSSAETTGGSHVLTVALKKAKPAVTRASRNPIPACADPRGYWDVLLMHVTAAVGTHSTSGVHAALKDVPQIEGHLTDELKHIAR